MCRNDLRFVCQLKKQTPTTKSHIRRVVIDRAGKLGKAAAQEARNAFN